MLYYVRTKAQSVFQKTLKVRNALYSEKVKSTICNLEANFNLTIIVKMCYYVNGNVFH